MAFLAWLVTGRPILFITGFLTGGLIAVTVTPYADVMQWIAVHGSLVIGWVLGE